MKYEAMEVRKLYDIKHDRREIDWQGYGFEQVAALPGKHAPCVIHTEGYDAWRRADGHCQSGEVRCPKYVEVAAWLCGIPAPPAPSSRKFTDAWRFHRALTDGSIGAIEVE